jgi:catechol 2,3-dioxygenase-like lactoylglutathione lyase family enzyme
MGIKIKEQAFVLHPITDVARSRDFYGNLLGLKVAMEFEIEPGVWWIEYDLAGAALAISNVRPSPGGGGGAVLALEVSDFDGTLAAIRAAKVGITLGPQEHPKARTFTISTPDGHSIMFHHLKA